MSDFQCPVRVYWEDTDAGGVVYHASYVRYFERGRTEWLRTLGWSQSQLAQEQKVLFSVVNLQIQYHRPARLDDLLQLVTHARIAGGASLQFDQQLRRDEEVVASSTVLVACVDSAGFRPRRLPLALRARIA